MHTGGLAVFTIIILTVLSQMKWILGIHSCLTALERGPKGSGGTITNTSQSAVMDGVHRGQRWRRSIRLGGQWSESMWHRWGEACVEEHKHSSNAFGLYFHFLFSLWNLIVVRFYDSSEELVGLTPLRRGHRQQCFFFFSSYKYDCIQIKNTGDNQRWNVMSAASGDSSWK